MAVINPADVAEGKFIKGGSMFAIRYIARATVAQISVYAHMVYFDGEQEDITGIIATPTVGAAVTLQNFQRTRKDGICVQAEVNQNINTANRVQRGQFYVMMGFDLTKGNETQDQTVRPTVIAKGYIYAGHSLTMGEFVEPGPGGGRGNRRVITITNPGAGNDLTTRVLTIDVGAIVRFIALRATLNTSSTAGTRTPVFRINNNDGTRYITVSGVNFATVSSTQIYHWQAGYGQSVDYPNTTANNLTDGTDTVSVRDCIPIELYLQNSEIIDVLTAGFITAAPKDSWTSINLVIEEWLGFESAT